MGMMKVSQIMKMRWLPLVMGGLCVALCMAGLYITQPLLLQRLDLKVYDAFLPLKQRGYVSDVPVIIDIDEAALAAHGQWPWPRYLLAELLDRLTASGVAAIGLDIMFAEADRTSPAAMRETLSKDKGVNLQFNGLPGELADYDTLFAASLRTAPAVLGAFARFDDNNKPVERNKPRPPALLAFGAPGALPFQAYMPEAPDAVLPLPAFSQAAPIAFVNIAPDADGIVRRIPLALRFGEDLYPSLAMGALMRAQAIKTLRAYTGLDGLLGLRAGDFSAPVSPEGNMLIPFQGGRKTYSTISAADVLAGRAGVELLQGRIALVGTSAPGLLDIRATPFERVMPGVEVHAAAIDALLEGDALELPPWAPGAQIMLILCAAIIGTAAFGFARPRVYLPTALLLVGAAILASRQLFLDGLFLSPLYAVLTTILCGVTLLCLRFWQEEKQKLLLRGAFSRYVSPEVVKRITKQRGDLLAGEERELSILFTDLRGFTTLSESLSPQEVVSLLNRYFTPMTAIVRSRQGTLDKFIGDALMAFWNAPLAVSGHPALAVDAALSMQEKLAELNDELEASFGVRLAMGAGIHTGMAYVGNMGSDDLVNYTLIGDSVNLASRLEGLCKNYKVPVVVSGEVAAQCEAAGADFSFQYIDSVQVKGRAQPVMIYQPARI
ncbi:MAG: adenylate/guanylate cyclase domain-containing protein [Deltaproteobacteria bacterium]|jgi:adenylate cyclase|nr:adenylate/guanylate cyclase domain-containing protein [Deltaproteobacteria bacterium]